MVWMGAAAASLALGLTLTACGGSSGGSGSDDSHWGFISVGPKNDGGYNASWQTTLAKLREKGVQVDEEYDVPYDQQLTQTAARFIQRGASVVLDAAGAGNLLSSCTESKKPGLACFSTTLGDPKNIPANTIGYYVEDWNSHYIAGAASALMSKTNKIGFISSFKITNTIQAVNAYAMGCQSVNPDCQVLVVQTNNYFDPPAEVRATRSLVNSGADVIRSYVDDPAFCKTAQSLGVYATSPFYDISSVCPKAHILSSVNDFSDYFANQLGELRDGKWKGGRLDWIPVGKGDGVPHISPIGKFVPADVKKKIEAVTDRIIDGEVVMKGPIYDTNGELKVPEGEELTNAFMWYQWDWYVKGVVASD